MGSKVRAGFKNIGEELDDIVMGYPRTCLDITLDQGLLSYSPV